MQSKQQHYKKKGTNSIHRLKMKPILLDALEELFPNKDWIVHHKDNNKHNNDILNLEVMERGSHTSTHSNGKTVNKSHRVLLHKNKYPGACYTLKHRNPSFRVWQSRIWFNKRNISLGYFEDPISASIVYHLVLEELNDVQK